MAYPSASYTPANIVAPQFHYATFTPIVAGTPGTAVSIKFANLKYDTTVETVEREVPDSDGFLRPDFQEQIKAGQTFDIESDEINSVAVFGGSTIEGAFTTGTVALWTVTRQATAATKAAIKSNTFKATWYLAGGYDLTAGQIAKGTIKVTALEKATLTPNATP
jgi:hypothetical protein